MDRLLSLACNDIILKTAIDEQNTLFQVGTVDPGYICGYVGVNGLGYSPVCFVTGVWVVCMLSFTRLFVVLPGVLPFKAFVVSDKLTCEFQRMLHWVAMGTNLCLITV